MFLLKKPTDAQAQQLIMTQRSQSFSYPEVGATRSAPPPHYVIDHHRTCLGTGQKTFERARAAICRWEMFSLEWVQLCWPDSPVEAGTTVAVLIHIFGLWSLNACRIIYVLEESGPVERFGFAYGTLPDHAECGEERFSVEWHHVDDSVWYDILAFSRPNQFLARLGYPYVRYLQRRFALDSLQAMRRAIQN